MKSAIIGTLCGLFVSTIICFGGFLAYQRVETDRQLNFQRYIYMRSKNVQLRIEVDRLYKDNDNLRIDIQLLKRQAPTPTPTPTPAPKKVNPC